MGKVRLHSRLYAVSQATALQRSLRVALASVVGFQLINAELVKPKADVPGGLVFKFGAPNSTWLIAIVGPGADVMPALQKSAAIAVTRSHCAVVVKWISRDA
jgi:hypothetical protein